MLIVTGKDYYDSAAGFGVDKTVRYVRKADERMSAADAERLLGLDAHCGEIPVEDAKDRYRGRATFGYRPFSVVVCGKIYRGYGTEELAGEWPDPKVVFRSIWTEDDFLSAAEEAGVVPSRRSFHYTKRRSMDVAAYFTPSDPGERTRSALIDAGITVMVERSATYGGERHWSMEPFDLGRLGFQKVIPPYEMHQEISMWVGGVLPRPGAPMVEIPDSIRAEKHGMDATSFRRPKGG
jgi:hypothetical protein